MSEMVHGEKLGGNGRSEGRKPQLSVVYAIAALFRERREAHETGSSGSAANGAERRRDGLRIALQESFCNLVEEANISVGPANAGATLVPLINYDSQSPYHTASALPQARDKKGQWHDGGASIPNDPKGRGVYFPGAWAIGLTRPGEGGDAAEPQLSALAAGTVTRDGRLCITEVSSLIGAKVDSETSVLVAAWEQIAESVRAGAVFIKPGVIERHAADDKQPGLFEARGYTLDAKTGDWQKVLAQQLPQER